MTVMKKRLEDWAKSASPGARLVYCRGGTRHEDAFEYARKLNEAGLVFLAQVRQTVLGQTVYYHVAIRTTPEAHVILDKVSALVDKRGLFRGSRAMPKAIRRGSDYSTGAHYAAPKSGRENLLDAA